MFSLFAPRAPIRTTLGGSASVGSLVAQTMGHTPKYDEHQSFGQLPEHPN